MKRYLNKLNNSIVFSDKPVGDDEFDYIEIPDDGKEYIYQDGIIEKPVNPIELKIQALEKEWQKLPKGKQAFFQNNYIEVKQALLANNKELALE
jgi:hypothetical protein